MANEILFDSLINWYNKKEESYFYFQHIDINYI